jgi:hypothetical protein
MKRGDMPVRCLVTASFLAVLAAATPARAQPPASAPPSSGAEPAPRKVWYGHQTLIVAGASVVTGAVPGLVLGESGFALAAPAGLGGLVFGGPIVHWAHGRVGRGFAVLGMNIGASGLGMGIVGLPVACAFEKCDGFYFTYGLLGSYVGALIGVIIDVSVLSTYEPAPQTMARTPRVIDTLAPVIDVRQDRTVLGVSGMF